MLELYLYYIMICLIGAITGVSLLLCLAVLGVGIYTIVEFCLQQKAKEKPFHDSPRSSSHD